MKRSILLILVLGLLVPAAAFGQLTLVPMKYSKVKLKVGTRSTTVDLDREMDGSYGTMPGNPPHKFKVLFTAAKGKFYYLVVNVRSRSPISDKNAPCGGDEPQSVLWIKVDRKLKHPQLQSEVYQSCSFNFYDSKVKRAKSTLVIDFGGSEKRRMTYDNRHPEKGIDVKPL